MSKIVVVMTCHNRREKTVRCLEKLHTGNDSNEYHYIVVDAGSSDGSCEEIEKAGYNDVELIHAEPTLFWNGGMHRGIEIGMKNADSYDYMLLVNDDVDFIPGIIDKMVDYSAKPDLAGSVIVGATCDTSGKFSYGGILYNKGISYSMVGIDRPDVRCTTFNANCTLIPMDIMKLVGNVDPYYKHSMGDFDLGFKITRERKTIYVMPEYVGVCNDNPIEGSWQDTSLGIRKRIQLKESFKGLPFKDWFHYLNKNFGLVTACVRSVTPYIKIFVGK